MKTEHLFCNFKDIMSGLDVENNESEFIKPQIITTVPKDCTFTLKLFYFNLGSDMTGIYFTLRLRMNLQIKTR